MSPHRNPQHGTPPRGAFSDEHTSSPRLSLNRWSNETSATFRWGRPFSFEPSESTRGMEDLGRGVAHKLRSGLCALRGSIELSLQQILPPTAREMLSVAEEGAHSITEIISDLVALTQRPEIHPRKVDVNYYVGTFLAHLRRQVEWRNVEMTYRFDGSRPHLWGDEDLLHKTFSAVTLNSLEAQASRLEVETSLDDDSVVVRFADNGRGLSEDSMEMAFQPYFTTKRGHRGMGLPLARWLVHVHQGTMSLESTPDRGAIVVLRWPRVV